MYARTEPDAANDPSKSIAHFRTLFVFLQAFGGQVGLPLFVGTMIMAPSVKRHWTLINFLISWIIYSVVYSLTVYHGGDLSSGEGHRLCFAQAALVHGVVPLAVTTYCALHIQVWLGIQTFGSWYSWIDKHRKAIFVTMIAAPYVAFVGFVVASLVVLLEHPNLLDGSASSYYCTINYNPLVYAVPGYAAVIIIVMLTLEGMIGYTLIRRWRALRRTSRLNAATLSMIIRIAVFSVYGFATLAACAGFLARTLTVWPYLIQASLPTAIFLCFGNRFEVWAAWCCCQRRDRGQTSSIPIRVTLDTTLEITRDEIASFDHELKNSPALTQPPVEDVRSDQEP